MSGYVFNLFFNLSSLSVSSFKELWEDAYPNATRSMQVMDGLDLDEVDEPTRESVRQVWNHIYYKSIGDQSD